MLPPQAVSIPRIDVPMEAILGIQSHRKDTLSPRSISEDFSSCDLRCKDEEDEQMKKKDDDDEMIKIYDGNSGLRRRLFRTVIISKRCTLKQLLTAALKTFHILQDPGLYCLVDAYAAEERDLEDPNPVEQLMKREGKRPAAFLRYKAASHAEGHIEVHPSQLNVSNQNLKIKVTDESTVRDVIFSALSGLHLDQDEQAQYQLSKVTLDKGAVSEHVMGFEEQPWEQLKADSRDSIRIMELTRFYIQKIEDPHGPNIALYVGNLPKDYKQLQYEDILMEVIGRDNKFQSIGPIYYEYGSLVITYNNSENAVRAFYALRDSIYEEKNLLVLLLPTISPSMMPPKVVPLLVFVNAKSGGCQGNDLIQSFRKLLNPYQVFDLDNGGPLPGLYVFRNISDYKILCCGGDGTVGWVLQCLDNVGQDSECCSPPCAIVPLGTGNDLARVLHWGAGYTGSEDPLSLLRDVIDAEDISLDRWTVVFHTDEKSNEERPLPLATTAQLPLGTQNEDNTQIFIMNNYFGIGIDADLCLDFHNAREENPNKFNSRLRNKGVYVKMGLRKMVSSKMCKDLHREITLDVDGKSVDLPAIEGLIVLNILSWGSGANPWGPEKEDGFNKPNHWDGALEVVGVTGVMHLGQIQSGLRSAIRIAQAGHIRIRVKHDVPVQVDGEPWIQSPGEIIIMRSALRARMLKKVKMRRRNTEPSIADDGESSTFQ
jgi:diacylglycerol kinase (ATP)